MTSSPLEGEGLRRQRGSASKYYFSVTLTIAVLAVSCIVFFGISDYSSADEEPESQASTQIGETDLYWAYDAAEHKLSITGTGEMPDYEPGDYPPWFIYAQQSIQKVEIGKDVSKIGLFGLSGLPNLATIEVEAGNASYKVTDGILYSTDGTVLVLYPSAKAGTEFTVPDGVTEIGPYAITVTKLETVNIGKDVETIGVGSLQENEQLTAVYFGTGSKVSRVDNYAFSNDTSLETFIFPGSIRSTGSALFTGSGLRHLEIESVLSEGETSSIGWGAFADIPSLTYAKIDVTEIGASAFENNRLVTLILGDNVKTVGADAFFTYSSKIITLTLGSGLEHISRNAFSMGDNNTFESIVLPEGLKFIGQGAFSGLKNVEELTIPSTVECIEDGAFYGLSGLKVLNYDVADRFRSDGSYVITEPFGIEAGESFADLTVNIGPHVRIIGPNLFRNCVNIKTLNFDEGVEQIYERAFENIGISELTLPGTLKYLGLSCFINCAYLESVTFNKDISTVLSSVFCKTTDASREPGKMISVVFGDDVTSIPQNIFDDSLGSVTLGNGYYTLGYSLPGNNVKTVIINAASLNNQNRSLFVIDSEKPTVDMTVTIGSGFRVQSYLFQNVTNLKNLTLSEGVKIGTNAFENTGITSLTIPSGAQVNGHAFDYCTSLTSVTIYPDVTLANYVFAGITFTDGSGNGFESDRDLAGFMFQGTSENMTLVKKGFTFVTNCDVVKSDYYGIPGVATSAENFQVEREYYDLEGWYSDETLSSKADLSVFPDGLVKVYAKWTPVKYDITYELFDGENDPSNPDTYDMDNIPVLKDAVKTGYTFKGWSTESSSVVPIVYDGDMVLYAIWEINYYTIRFVNYDGTTVLQETSIQYGYTPYYGGVEPVRAADAQFTYTFSGWNPSIAQVTGNATYTAEYETEINIYTVTFKNYDGAVLQSTDYEYGETPVYSGATPVKAANAQYTFAFDGWSPEIASVTGEATYTAVFASELRSFEISFDANGGNGEMVAVTKTYGTAYALPECTFTAPEHMEFKCWSVGDVEKDAGAEITVTENITLKAEWQYVKHTVSFAPGDGSGDMASVKVEYNKGFTLPASTFTAPAEKQFKCWSVGGEEKKAGMEITVTGDVTATALWEDIPVVTYEVSFVANGGSGTMGTVNVAGTYVLPECGFTAPSHKEFKCWSVGGEEKAVDSTITVSSNIEITAVWTTETFTVTFFSNGGTSIVDQTVEYGSKAVRPDNPTRASTVSTDYRFADWYTEEGLVNVYDFDSSVTANVALYAKWTESPVPYEVSFDTNGGSVISAQIVGYGSKAIRPDNPTRDSSVSEIFTFAGWYSDPGFVNEYDFDSEVTGNVFLYAKWTSSAREYEIVFKNYDGTELKRSNVAYGATPSYDDTPTREGNAQYTYSFNGWDSPIVSVTGDKIYTATYSQTVNSYTVTFVDYDGTTVLQATSVQYGSTPAYTAATPVRAADAQYTYTFSGWSPSFAQVTGNATYTAEYDTKVNNYTVTFETNGGSSADSQTIDYGGKAVRPADPTKESSVSEVFTFAGWFFDAGLTAAYDFDTPVHGNLTLYAKWDSKVREYTVSFINHDGTVLQSSDVPYGETPVYSGDEPSKAATAEYSYAFSGWDSPIGSVTGNNTYTAQFTETPNTYTVTFDTAGGSVISSASYKYGENIAAPDTPTRDGYEFLGWTPALPAPMPAANLTVTARWASLPEISGDTIGFSSDGDRVSIDLGSTTVSEAMSDASKTSVSVSGNGWEMSIPKDVLSGASGAVSVSAQTMSDDAKASLPASVKERVQGKTVYSLDLSDSNGSITFAGKKIKVSLPYTLAAGENADNVKVFCINGENLEEFDATYDSEKKVAIFETEHFSDWFVDVVESPSGNNGGGFPIWIVAVIVVIAALVAVVVLMKMGIIPDLLFKKA